MERGSIVGLVGENGAGKSTLMNILGGVVPLDAGQMLLDGEVHAPRDPRDADRAGIAFIHQELNLFTNLTIAENFFISDFPTMGKVPLLSRGEIRRRAQEFLAMVDLDVSPDVQVERLAPGERQLVEVAKALSVDARIIIFDEPTTSLTARETERLFEIIDRLHQAGKTIIYISHILRDVMRLADADRRPARRRARGPRPQVGVHHPQHDRGHGRARHRAALPGPHIGAPARRSPWRCGSSPRPASATGSTCRCTRARCWASSG